jgi:hypothetical protein
LEDRNMVDECWECMELGVYLTFGA